MKNKIILGGLSIFTIGIMMPKLRKTYINFIRKSKNSWKYYE